MATSSERIVTGLRAAGIPTDVVHLGGNRPHLTWRPEPGGARMNVANVEDAAHGLRVAWEACRTERADGAAPYSHVIAFGGQLPLLAGPVWAAWLGAPLVTLLRGNDFDTSVFHPLRRPVLDGALQRSRAVVTVSREMGQRVRALHPQARVTAIPNGIAARDWQALPSDHARAVAWRAARLEPGRPVIGAFGQIKAKKGGHLLLDGLELAGMTAVAELLFVGEVDDDVRARAAAMPDLHVTFVAPEDRHAMIPWYLSCDVVAVPSLYDGLPNVVLEAGALGKPVLASRAGGIPEVVADERFGWLFDVLDAEDCARALEEFHRATPEQRAGRGTALARRVLEEFSAEIETAAYVSLLREADSSPAGGRGPGR